MTEERFNRTRILKIILEGRGTGKLYLEAPQKAALKRHQRVDFKRVKVSALDKPFKPLERLLIWKQPSSAFKAIRFQMVSYGVHQGLVSFLVEGPALFLGLVVMPCRTGSHFRSLVLVPWYDVGMQCGIGVPQYFVVNAEGFCGFEERIANRCHFGQKFRTPH